MAAAPPGGTPLDPFYGYQPAYGNRKVRRVEWYVLLREDSWIIHSFMWPYRDPFGDSMGDESTMTAR